RRDFDLAHHEHSIPVGRRVSLHRPADRVRRQIDVFDLRRGGEFGRSAVPDAVPFELRTRCLVGSRSNRGSQLQRAKQPVGGWHDYSGGVPHHGEFQNGIRKSIDPRSREHSPLNSCPDLDAGPSLKEDVPLGKQSSVRSRDLPGNGVGQHLVGRLVRVGGYGFVSNDDNGPFAVNRGPDSRVWALFLAFRFFWGRWKVESEAGSKRVGLPKSRLKQSASEKRRHYGHAVYDVASKAPAT